ncbi:MAG: protein kinase [Deltaproteobacteria bacterium]|nr:protein kinase [Deltaproteobacteria bacterium]
MTAEGKRDAVDDRELERGQAIAGYKIRQRVGAGPHGVVYAAVHPTTGEKVAVKLLHPAVGARAEAALRLEALAREVRELDGAALLALREVGRLPDGGVYAIAEFAAGSSLLEVLEGLEPLEPAEAGALLEGLVAGLSCLHQRGLCHGDLKPQNVFVVPRPDGVWPPGLRLADHGMAALEPRAGEAELPAALLDGRPAAEGLSPEQLLGAAPDARSDVFALGVLAYRLVTGAWPFDASSGGREEGGLLDEPVPPPSQRLAAAEPVEAAILRALARAPEARYPDAAAFMEAFRSGASAQPEPVALEPVADPAPVKAPAATSPADPAPVEAPVATAPEPLASVVSSLPVEAAPEPPSTPPLIVPVPDDVSTAVVARGPGGRVLGSLVWTLLWLLLACGTAVLAFRLVADRWPFAP